MFSEDVCECGVTECLNYGLIVSLAGFCCCHHIGPVKVNYWNMFICCQPLPQAVTCMETQTNTHTDVVHSNNSQGTSCPSSPRHFPQLFCFCLSTLCTLLSQPPLVQTHCDPAASLQPLTSPAVEIQAVQLHKGPSCFAQNDIN